MQNGILGYYSEWNKGIQVNMGDYVQSLAASEFFKKIDCFIPREKINSYKNKDKIRVILNGWFMDCPENFPPNNCIVPLFMSFHVFPDIAKDLLTDSTIEYLKQHSPIGCRDKSTEELLKKHGIDSYYSGCLTLTLGEKYKTDIKTDEIYFVDSDICKQSIVRYFKVLPKFFGILKLCKIWKEQKFQSKSFLKRLKKAISFYILYSKEFSNEILLNAKYICQFQPLEIFKNEQEKLDYAKDLVKRYASAKLVVTSRIHCALPCVGLETSVIFVTDKSGDIGAGGRLGGLIDLFDKVARTTKNGLVFVNREKQDYIPLKNALIKRVNEFLQKTEGMYAE